MAIVFNQSIKIKWHNTNKKYLQSYGYVFTKMGDVVNVRIKHIKGTSVMTKFQCDYCHNEFEKPYDVVMRFNNHFCSSTCYHKYRSLLAKLKQRTKTCQICSKKYKVPAYQYETSKYCSNECRHIGQSLTMKGREYVERIFLNCEWCGNEIKRLPKKVNTYNFCNSKCLHVWQKEVLGKQEDYIKRNKEILLKNLTDGKISFLKSKPQLIINNLLTEKGIRFTNEKLFGDYAVDIYLEDYDLLLEVNGSYWHCDQRIYDTIKYDVQLTKIMIDTKKKSFIKNQFNQNILYLWEFDITTNIDLCGLLIDEYVKNKGSLEKYHSFNYFVNNEKLFMENNQMIPYMDWKFEDLTPIVNLDVREKVTRINPKNHVTFNCDQCGKEKTQKRSVYNKRKHHFCSKECMQIYNQIGNDSGKIINVYNCDNCNNEFKVKYYKIKELEEGKRKSLCCSRECSDELKKKRTKGLVI